jgi:HD-GYP domain-containing protein (c-di-GMP phosphodiesterase class II)
VVVGYTAERDTSSWQYYESIFQRLNRSVMTDAVRHSLDSFWKEEPQIGFVNQNDLKRPEYGDFIRAMHARNVQVNNMVYFLSRGLCIITLNHGREVGQYDAAILQGMVTLGDSLRSLARQVQETEDAFEYSVHALARASEVNDEDTGQHILRIGEYAGFIAEKLKLPEKMVKMIRQQAPLHDVGKLYLPESILKKPGPLTYGELAMMKLHSSYGAAIIGDHPRFAVGRNIALSHHERWDGSGYPGGKKGKDIPIEGRIVALADQYDALRNKRVYKDALDHPTAHAILTVGDGRTMPSHFDSEVLLVFHQNHHAFEEMYEKMKG